jgi:hypothetical protein
MKTVMDAVNELDVMDIDWSKAPEGATHWIPNGYEWSKAFLSISDGEKVEVFRGGAWHETGNQHSIHSLTKLGLKAKPKPAQPVFTQAMADAGERPPIGSHARLKVSCPGYVTKSPLAGEVVFIGAHFKTNVGKLLCSYINPEESEGGIAVAGAFEVIDTRTDEEKAIDCLDDFNLSMCNGWQEDVIGFIKSGEFHGVKWVGE